MRFRCRVDEMQPHAVRGVQSGQDLLYLVLHAMQQQVDALSAGQWGVACGADIQAI